jgi:8-oxo-dGTP diphosphatase
MKNTVSHALWLQDLFQQGQTAPLHQSKNELLDFFAVRLQSELNMATQPAPIVPADPPVIKAAGGILQRSSPRGDEVMVVYRKRHQDWTLPRGKVKDGESFQEAAVREVLEETGCSCRIGNYLGTISYSAQGVPKVVLFWKMTIVDDNGAFNPEEIGEAVWLPIPSAIERLSYAQEKALLSRLRGSQKQAGTEPVTATQAPQESPTAESPAPGLPDGAGFARSGMAGRADFARIAVEAPALPQKYSAEDRHAYSLLMREAEAFRVELGFLERRNPRADNAWATAAHEQLSNVQRCLESNDIEDGWFCLHAAQRYAVFGMNQAELANQAYILREEAARLSSWRGDAIDHLLAVSDDQLTPERVADAMTLRNADSIYQSYRTQAIGDQLRFVLILCGVAAAALAPFMLLSGRIPMIAAVLFFGLLGAAFCSVQSLIGSRNEPVNQNLLVTLTPVLFGATCGLAGYAIYEYMAFLTFHSGEQHTGAIMAISFLFGCLGQRLLARVTGVRKRKKLPT